MPDIASPPHGASSQVPIGDRRVRRSRGALTAAFTELALHRGYGDIGVNDVAKHADVGRSTLYTHFSGLNELLAHSLDAHLSTLARCAVKPDMEPELTEVIAHFWSQRKVARTMLHDEPGIAIKRHLVARFEQTLLDLRTAHRSRSTLPILLIAEQLAAGQLALIDTWLAGRASASPDEVARLLHSTTYSGALSSL